MINICNILDLFRIFATGCFRSKTDSGGTPGAHVLKFSKREAWMQQHRQKGNAAMLKTTFSASRGDALPRAAIPITNHRC